MGDLLKVPASSKKVELLIYAAQSGFRILPL